MSPSEALPSTHPPAALRGHPSAAIIKVGPWPHPRSSRRRPPPAALRWHPSAAIVKAGTPSRWVSHLTSPRAPSTGCRARLRLAQPRTLRRARPCHAHPRTGRRAQLYPAHPWAGCRARPCLAHPRASRRPHPSRPRRSPEGRGRGPCGARSTTLEALIREMLACQCTAPIITGAIDAVHPSFDMQARASSAARPGHLRAAALAALPPAAAAQVA